MNKPRLMAMLLIFLISLVAPATVQAFQTDSAGQCVEGVQLFFDGKAAEAFPLLQAGFAERESATFANPDDEAICALLLGVLHYNTGNQSSALEAYQVALDIFQMSGNRELEGMTANNIGEVYRTQEQYELALEIYQQALEISREVGHRALESSTLNNMGLVYYHQEQYELTLKQLNQALSIRREVSDRAGEGDTVNNIGEVYHAQGQYELALEQFQLALEISREVGDRASESGTLNNMGAVYDHQGQYELALEQFQQALEIAREVSDPAGEGTALNNIAMVYQDQEKYHQALEHYNQALFIFGEMGNRVGEGKTLNNMAGIYDNQEMYDNALDYYNRALEIRRELGDRVGEGITLNDIGLVYAHQGIYDDALEHYNQALKIGREVGDRAGEIATLNNIAVVYHSQGKYNEALERYNQVLFIYREKGDRANEGVILNNIGAIYRAQGKYNEALEQLKRALEITREIGDRAREGYFLGNIAAIYRIQGKYDEALEQNTLALEIKIEVGDRSGEGRTLNNIAAVYENLGKYDEALKQFQKALQIRREVGDRMGEGATLNNIASIYNAQGKYDEALEQYVLALEITREVQDRTGEGNTLGNIGFLYKQQDQTEKALVYYEKALDVFETVRATGGSEEKRASFIAQYADLYHQAIGLYHQQAQNEEAFRTSERSRARSFLDSLATGVVQLYDDEAQALWDQELAAYNERQATQDALARAKALNPPDLELVADLEQQLASASEAHKAAIAAIEARGGQLADLVPGRTKRVSLSEIQADLPENTTLVSYHILGDNDTLAFILTPEKLNVVSLGVGSQDLREQITAFSFSFAHPDLDSVDAHQSEELQQLYEWLITPLKPHLNTSGVTIVPHGILHYLPFAALTDGERYFSDDYVLSTLPSASVLPSIQENRKPDTTIESVLALGNPTGDLQFAEQEVATIADLFGDSVQTLVRADATESAFRASEANILHVAAHGEYDPKQPLSSVLKLTGDATTDGDLQVSEVYGLEFTNTSLVVLSACETGLRSLNKGDDESIITDGDEIVALNRAFLFAGTPSVLSTLWSVDDESTGLLMEHFYTHLRDGMGKAQALRQAQIDVREEYPHPYYWAGFVLSGDGGEVTNDVPPTAAVTPVATTSTIPQPVVTASNQATPKPVATVSPTEGTLGSGPFYGGIALLLGLAILAGIYTRKRTSPQARSNQTNEKDQKDEVI